MWAGCAAQGIARSGATQLWLTCCARFTFEMVQRTMRRRKLDSTAGQDAHRVGDVALVLRIWMSCAHLTFDSLGLCQYHSRVVMVPTVNQEC
jgi:hypothetical protein